MNPYICHKHGEVEHYFHRANGRIYRQCFICKAENAKRYNIEKKVEIKKYHADLYQKNIEQFRTKNLEKNRNQKLQIIQGYGGKCDCCGETKWEFLTIDHINGGGRRERNTIAKGGKLYRRLIKEGFPRNGYRLLCLNCNFSLWRYGYCPHKKSEQGCPQDS
jgi:hypothetical protein